MSNFVVSPFRSQSLNFLLQPGERWRELYVFAKSEPLPVKVHSDLLNIDAYILPVDHPFAAITDADGKYQIKDLPAGEYTFYAWHERVGALPRTTVKIEAGNETENTLRIPGSDFVKTSVAPKDTKSGDSGVASDDLIFEDNFDNGLSDKWQVIGLKKEEDYRIRDGGLELRVQPGKLTRDTPMLKVILPIGTSSSAIGSVDVTVLDEFTEDGEFGGLSLIADDHVEFTVKKLRVNGSLVFAPGKYEGCHPAGAPKVGVLCGLIGGARRE